MPPRLETTVLCLLVAPLVYAQVATLPELRIDAQFGTLIAAGMANPDKVLGFLDLGGSWDPSLVFVMGGAVAVAAVAFTFARGKKQSLLGADMKLSTSRVIDRRLVLGSILFGVGWGIAGYCQGPGLVALGMGEVKTLVFVIAMLAGMGMLELLERRRMAHLERAV